MNNRRPRWEQRLLRQCGRAVSLLLLAMVQTSLFPAISYFRINIVLVAVVCWTLLRGLVPGARWAMYGGLALGLLSPLPLGAHLLGLVLVALLLAVATEAFPRENLLLLTLCVIAGSVVQGLVLAGVMHLSGRPTAWLLFPITVLLPEALVNLVIAVPMYLVLRALRQRERARGWA